MVQIIHNLQHQAVCKTLKQWLSKLMKRKTFDFPEMLQPGQILSDLDTIDFDKGAIVEPQLEYMTRNVYRGKYRPACS